MLGDLLTFIVQKLLDKAKAGELTTQEMRVARDILRDNHIEAGGQRPRAKLTEMAEAMSKLEIPEFDSE
jgi:hypothetical protein